MSHHVLSHPERPALLATFVVRETLCAIDAAGIQEVIRLGPVTPVRHAPEDVLGVVNLRGRIVTVLDLGLKFGFGQTAPSPESRIIMMEHHNEFVGLLVDRVEEVVEVEAAQWERPPANLSGNQARFYRAVCRIRERVATLLDLEQVLGEQS